MRSKVIEKRQQDTIKIKSSQKTRKSTTIMLGYDHFENIQGSDENGNDGN